MQSAAVVLSLAAAAFKALTTNCDSRFRFENLIQIRCLLEHIPTDDILSSWHTLLPQYMAKWGCTRQEVRNVLFCCTGMLQTKALFSAAA